MKETLLLIFRLFLLAIFIGCIIWGQQTAGYLYLGVQLLGLSGLLGLLYRYNKTYQ